MSDDRWRSPLGTRYASPAMQTLWGEARRVALWRRLWLALMETERELGLDSIRVCADLFHMNIEEDDLAKAIVDTGRWLAHVHVDDSNRLQPGTGHLDFAAALGALRTVGYDGWLALECRLRGDPETALPATARFLAPFL